MHYVFYFHEKLSVGLKSLKIYILTLLALAHVHIVNANELDKIVIGNFSSGQLDGWEVKVFADETRYHLVQLENETVLKAKSHDSASGLVKKVTVDLHKYPYLNWRWRIENRLRELDEKHKSGDDYSARIYIIVSGGYSPWNTKALNYVWSNNSQKGESWPNAFAKKNAIMLAVRSAEDEISTWYNEKRNVYEDFKHLFGANVRHIDAVALMFKIRLTYRVIYYRTPLMIKSFRDKRTQQFYEGKRVKSFQVFSRQAEKRLRILDAADKIEALILLPSNRFEALGGNRQGQYSIRINDKWRICFEWEEGQDGPEYIEITDYH